MCVYVNPICIANHKVLAMLCFLSQHDRGIVLYMLGLSRGTPRALVANQSRGALRDRAPKQRAMCWSFSPRTPPRAIPL